MMALLAFLWPEVSLFAALQFLVAARLRAALSLQALALRQVELLFAERRVPVHPPALYEWRRCPASGEHWRHDQAGFGNR